MSVNWIGLSAKIKECNYHSHETWEIVLNLTGNGTALTRDIESEFYPGLISCIPPFIPHSKNSGDGFMDLFMHVDKFIIPDCNDTLFFMDDEEKSIETLMRLMHRIFHKKNKNTQSVVNALDSSIQQMLLSWCDKKEINEGVEILKNEIIKNFTNPEFRISDVLNVTSYSKDHIRRCFKSDTSQTPLDYLQSLRINYAIDLLNQKKASGLSISEIAYLTGFYDPRYFSRVFKKKTGLSPKQYAEQSIVRSDNQSFVVEIL